ncbi:MAG: TIGR03960 family B12-binding radical SAM protein [Bacillota bacterium]|nr:TIGR03960 family B12-binding radical SAM protein [Bacillota bacterium]
MTKPAVNLPRHLLRSVTKPARYVGGEYNNVVKEPVCPDGTTLTRFAFCFPDVYEIGMSNVALHILYHVLNKRSDTWCERAFAPWTDMEAGMRRLGLPLYALESKNPLDQFDFLGFTLQYELAYTNVLNMLDLAGVPLTAAERGPNDPLVIAGGPVVYNIEPMADFFDLVLIGEGEELVGDLIDLYRTTCPDGRRTPEWDRAAFLRQAADIEGVYVPSLYAVAYNDDGTVAAIKPTRPDVRATVRKRIVLDLDAAAWPDKSLVPNTEIVHDRMFLELFRGCPRGCRFCQAGMIYRPVREKKASTLVSQAIASEQATGYDEIGLLSLSTSDYRELGALTDCLLDQFTPHHTNLSLPSLRLDSFSFDLMNKAARTRKSGLTFAPEAGRQRLRDVINKNITDEDLYNAMQLAFEGGWNGAKLYFMLGLPTETDEDVLGIAEMLAQIETLYRSLPREQRPRRLEMTVSTAVFIPKPHTPFQWVGQAELAVVQKRQQMLRERLRNRPVKYQWHDAKTALLEAILARGDRRLGPVIRAAWRSGRTFDAWDDHFDLDTWLNCMKEAGLDPAFYTSRQRPAEEIFPWSHIDCGVSRTFLLAEYEKALLGQTTPQCRIACSDCGAASFEGGICFDC